MRTSININDDLLQKLKGASDVLGISTHDVIGMLVTRLTHDKRFEVRLFETVTYQDCDPEDCWEKFHVKFEPVFYEKCQDLRRNFKYSVSWFIAFAIEEYLDSIVQKLLDPEKLENIVDNYDYNYVYLAQNLGDIPSFYAIWGIPEEEYLKRILY